MCFLSLRTWLSLGRRPPHTIHLLLPVSTYINFPVWHWLTSDLCTEVIKMTLKCICGNGLKVKRINAFSIGLVPYEIYLFFILFLWITTAPQVEYCGSVKRNLLSNPLLILPITFLCILVIKPILRFRSAFLHNNQY